MVVTVYLADGIQTALAEYCFYFQREYLQTLDAMHLSYPSVGLPLVQKDAVLWKIEFRNPINDIADLTNATAPHFNVFPCMMTNPSQDYRHLKDRRNAIQALHYDGLRAGSSRSTAGGQIYALFNSQHANVARISPVRLEIRLIQSHGGAPFTVHATDSLDFEACEVRALPSNPIPAWASRYSTWQTVRFNH